MYIKHLKKSILFSFITALLSFVYFIFKGHGVFTVVDDFNNQMIVFAATAWEFFRGGHGEWIWNIDFK